MDRVYIVAYPYTKGSFLNSETKITFDAEYSVSSIITLFSSLHIFFNDNVVREINLKLKTNAVRPFVKI